MEQKLRGFVDKLEQTEALTREEWTELLSNFDENVRLYAARKAQRIAQSVFGNGIYIRGLIEFSNYCKKDCYYCGIRRSNGETQRYRLTREDILACCREGWGLGFRTFVLQGGEDGYYQDTWYEELLCDIKTVYSECAITLSIGERTRESYQRLFDAGADRYLLRHETANPAHYARLHPKELSLAHRKECLYWLKEIGYQVGCGFMVGTPYQTVNHLAEDMEFIHEFGPHMVGIGPFIPARNTPFEERQRGSLELTLFILSLIRIMEKRVLLPATTALGTIHPQGREMGIEAGANVVMPNLSPVAVREKYALYDQKVCTGEESAQCREGLEQRVKSIGYEIVTDRGDYSE